jgi:uncharacterized protein YdcH (DUF465 family)
MVTDHHDLVHEFPQHREQIHTLKTHNAHFAKMFDEYHVATREVERLEAEGIPVADESLEELKKKRLKLKDGLYAMLTA